MEKRGLHKEDDNGTFLLTIHRALEVTADVLRAFYFNGKE